MKWFSSLITIVLFLAILVMPTFAEDVKPVMARPVSIGGKSIKSIEPLTPDGKWAISQAKKLYVDLTGKTVEYTLIITEEAIDLAGAKFPVWAFGKEGEKGTVPGPTIGAVQGDFVRVIVKNKSQSNHTLRLHGPLTIRYGMSGVPDVAQEPIRPGEQFVYEFVAYPAGTHIYHGHINTNEPMNKGLYGPLIILPKQAGSDL
ncbi:MAG: multicopper oxidase domain-containing protein, partial [Candidatus Tectomicrobia bacterium]|nr:multicopper oxidase domain-containing protein [Candidatus Tectomicrobia bacterium]